MKSFLRFMFRKKDVDPTPPARMEQMLASAKSKAIFVPLSPEGSRYEAVKEENSVTGVYEVVRTAMKEAVGEKRKAKEAAQRISASIGTAGQEKPKS
jgi:hypothetical protein